MPRRIASGGPYERRIGYCRAVVADGWIHVSGTTAREDPLTGRIPEGVVAQCESALGVISAVLAGAGAGFRDVVRVTYMLRNAADFPACFDLLRATFGVAPPAATMIECALIDPAYLIEIEVTAFRATPGD